MKKLYDSVDEEDHNVQQVSFTGIYLIESNKVNKCQAIFSIFFVFIEFTTTCRQYCTPELTFSGEETRVSVSGHTSRQLSTDMSQEYAELLAQDSVFQETLAPDEGSVTDTLL